MTRAKLYRIETHRISLPLQEAARLLTQCRVDAVHVGTVYIGASADNAIIIIASALPCPAKMVDMEQQG